MFKLITEEQIKEALEKANITLSNEYIYEITTSGFGKVLDLPRLTGKLCYCKIEGETRVSYICGEKRINKKTYTYTDRYTGCIEKCTPSETLVQSIWLNCNKHAIIDELRYSRNYTLFKKIYGELIDELG